MQRTFQLPVELGPLEVTRCMNKTDIHIRHHALKKKSITINVSCKLPNPNWNHKWDCFILSGMQCYRMFIEAN